MRATRKKDVQNRQERRASVLSELCGELRLACNHLPSFGPELGSLSGKDAADVVVAHRILSKFELPSHSDVSERRLRTIRESLELDNATIDYHEAYHLAAARLGYWFKGFRPTYSFHAPSGASSVPFSTDDVFEKLRDETLWEVSPTALDYACKVAYYNSALKRIVKMRFRANYPYLTMCDLFRQKHGANPYQCFREMFKTCVTFNAVSRIETVPKNNQTDRMITCVPLWDMVCQLSLMYDMREHVKQKLGYDIAILADLHKERLRDSNLATIDLKSASDTCSLGLIKTLWPNNVLKHLLDLRSSVASYREEPEYIHHFMMFSPMGTGLTFDVMTLTLLALLRDDPEASVFGDDIIVSKSFCPKAFEILKAAGFIINTRKSFVDGKFRESCGGMYHEDIGYIKSYEIRYPTNIVDVINICNKLDEIVQAGQCNRPVLAALDRARQGVLESLPRVVKTRYRAQVGDTYVYDENHIECETEALAYLRTVLQRECSIHTAYSVVSISLPSGDDIYQFARALYGGRQASTKRTHVVGRAVETWSGLAVSKLIPKP